MEMGTRKVAFYTLGCTLDFSEPSTSGLRQALTQLMRMSQLGQDGDAASAKCCSILIIKPSF